MDTDLRKLFDTMAAIEESAMRGFEDDISPYDDDKREYEAEYGEEEVDFSNNPFRNVDDNEARAAEIDDLLSGDDPWGIGEDNLDMDGEELPAGHEEYGDEEFGMDGDKFHDESVEHQDLMERDVREMTNKLLQDMDEGTMDPRTVADAALSYMSEHDVSMMAQSNDWYQDEYDDEDDDGIDQDFNWNQG